MCVIWLKQGLHRATSHTACQQLLSPASEGAASKLAVPITRRNEKAGQSANNALVHHSVPQR
jgi:hypothetical protein